MAEDVTRRSFERYPCSGSAEIFQDGKRCAWGTVNEFARGGCYVETSHPLPAGTVVQLRLTVAGAVIDTGAVVAWITPQVGMGIRFQPSSPEVAAALNQVVRKLSEDGQGTTFFSAASELDIEWEDRFEENSNAIPAVSPEAAPRILERILEQAHQKGALTEQELLQIVNADR